MAIVERLIMSNMVVRGGYEPEPLSYEYEATEEDLTPGYVTAERVPNLNVPDGVKMEIKELVDTRVPGNRVGQPLTFVLLTGDDTILGQPQSVDVWNPVRLDQGGPTPIEDLVTPRTPLSPTNRNQIRVETGVNVDAATDAGHACAIVLANAGGWRPNRDGVYRLIGGKLYEGPWPLDENGDPIPWTP